MTERREELLKKIVSAIDALPPLPESIRDLKKASRNKNAVFAEFLPIIEKDPSICADILHIVNSSYYSRGKKISSISEALRILGITNLINYITLSFSDTTLRKQFKVVSSINEYFAHSREIATASKILAETMKLSRNEIDTVYMAGLLHDMGRLVIIAVAQENREELLHINDWHLLDEIVENEEELLGINHCYTGKEISSKWEFPEELQNAILYHHTPVKEGLHRDSAIIFLAHFISMPDIDISLLQNIFPPAVADKLKIDGEIIKETRTKFLREASQNLHKGTT